jgi:hypothetical protein
VGASAAFHFLFSHQPNGLANGHHKIIISVAHFLPTFEFTGYRIQYCTCILISWRSATVPLYLSLNTKIFEGLMVPGEHSEEMSIVRWRERYFWEGIST